MVVGVSYPGVVEAALGGVEGVVGAVGCAEGLVDRAAVGDEAGCRKLLIDFLK